MAAPTAPTLTPIVIGVNGLGKLTSLVAALAAAAASDGDAYKVQGQEVLVISNGSGAPVDVTITSAPDNFGAHHAADDLTLTVADGDVGVIGPLAAAKFADANGLAQVNYSDPTDVLVGILTVGVSW